jgi:hypothetical protein
MLPTRCRRLDRRRPQVASLCVISLRQTRLRTAIVIAATTAGVSVLVGVVWAFLAPAEHLLVVSEGRGVALTGESLHQFDASAVFIWLALIVGVLSAWLARLSRGPYALGGLIVGSAAGAGLMALVGSGVTKLRFPTADNPAVGEIIARAPNIGTLLVLLFQPLAACVVTLVLAVLNPYDDLGVGDHPESGDRESGDPATEAEQTDDEVQPKLP